MHVRKIGDYTHKGSTGIYVQSHTTGRYAAIDWCALPDEQFPAIRRGELFEVPDAWLEQTFERIDECLDA